MHHDTLLSAAFSSTGTCSYSPRFCRTLFPSQLVASCCSNKRVFHSAYTTLLYPSDPVVETSPPRSRPTASEPLPGVGSRYVWVPSPSPSFKGRGWPAPNILVLLHGLGDTETRYADLARAMGMPGVEALAVRAPHALLPEGSPELGMPGAAWYAAFEADGHPIDGTAPGETRRLATLDASRKMLHVLFDGLGARGFPPKAIFLLGYGQGGVAALDAALAYRAQLGGVVAASSDVFLAEAAAGHGKQVGSFFSLSMAWRDNGPETSTDRTSSYHFCTICLPVAFLILFRFPRFLSVAIFLYRPTDRISLFSVIHTAFISSFVASHSVSFCSSSPTYCRNNVKICARIAVLATHKPHQTALLPLCRKRNPNSRPRPRRLLRRVLPPHVAGNSAPRP